MNAPPSRGPHLGGHIRETNDQRLCLGCDLKECFTSAVNELGAEIDRDRQAAWMPGPDAPSDPISGFEQNDRKTRAREEFSRGQPRRSGSYDDDVARSVGQA
jgi:hypothetical protein